MEVLESVLDLTAEISVNRSLGWQVGVGCPAGTAGSLSKWRYK